MAHNTTTHDEESSAKARIEKEKGNEAFKKKEYQEAIRHYDDAIAFDPTRFTFYSNKAAALLSLKDYEGCLVECDNAIKKGAIGDDEGDHKALLSKLYYRMGCSYEELGKIRKAAHYMKHSVQVASSPAACERMLILFKKIAGEKVEKPKHIGCNIVRRKLNDTAMHHFLLGNTPAASVLAKDARYEHLLFGSATQPVRFLFSGAGDARNLLTSLKHLSRILSTQNKGTQRTLELHMNDSNPSILARNIVLLILASESPDDEQLKKQTNHCCAIWMNTTLCDDHYRVLMDILDRLLHEQIEEHFPWLKFRNSSLDNMREVWNIWRHCPISNKMVVKMRKEQMQKSPVIPNQTQEYKAWLQSGCLPFGDGGDVCDKANPTLLDYVTFKFCETQGPFLAFDELQQAPDVARKLVSKWGPLLSEFYYLLKNPASPIKPEVHVWGGDVMQISEKIPEDIKFDFIDTSNLMDYLGLVNILVNLRPMLVEDNPFACIQVENVIGASTTAEDVLRQYCKIDPKKLLMMLGLRSAEVQNPAGNVRIKFFLDKPTQSSSVTLKDPLKEFYTKIASEPPFPDSPNPSMAFLMGRILPALTVGTLVGIIEIVCGEFSVFPKESVSGLLDDLINPDSTNRPFLRNRIFALRALCVAVGERISPSIKNFNYLPPQTDIQHYCLAIEPLMDMALMRGGIGEPSLAVLLFPSKELCVGAQSKMAGEPTYQHIKKQTYEELQVIDNISYDIHANILQFDLLKSDMEKMKEGYLAVFEVEKHFIICKPVPMSKVLESHT